MICTQSVSCISKSVFSLNQRIYASIVTNPFSAFNNIFDFDETVCIFDSRTTVVDSVVFFFEEFSNCNYYRFNCFVRVNNLDVARNR